MLVDEIMDTDPVLQQWLLKLHKGATAGFNAKTTKAVLGLFDGWTMSAETFIKPSDELGYNSGFRKDTSISFEEYSETFKRMMPRSFSLNPSADHDNGLRLTVQSYSENEAQALHANVAKYAVAKLPDPKKTKPDDYLVLDLTTPEAKRVKDDDDSEIRWVWSFNLYRKCKGYRITAPDGQFFDVCGPVQILGYGGTKDFAAFFQWALANTDLEASVNAKLGLSKHLKASERPRVPVGGQSIGKCAICFNEQVVRNERMVLHGYQRPGHGYIIGNCFGVGYKPYELSAEACIAYVPHLEATKVHYTQRLTALNAGKVPQFVEKKRNYRTGQDVDIVIKKGDTDYPNKLKAAIVDVTQQIAYITKDIVEIRRRIKDWQPGTLRRIEGLPGVTA